MKTLVVFVTAVLLSHPALALDRLRIAMSNPNMPNLTVATAQAKGFFKEENIETEIIRMNPNVEITALASGISIIANSLAALWRARSLVCR